MFEKSKLSFRSKQIFESNFRASINTCFNVVAKMLFDGIINVDGTIDMKHTGRLRKYQLWSYIYYLYYYNHSTLDIFANMLEKDKANAYLFYEQVRLFVDSPYVTAGTIKPLDVNSLIYFINKLIHTKGDSLTNPVIHFLQTLLSDKETISKLKGLTVITGTSVDGTMVEGKNAEGAEVVVRFTPSA